MPRSLPQPPGFNPDEAETFLQTDLAKQIQGYFLADLNYLISCKDCGSEFPKNANGRTSVRCELCRKLHKKQQYREYVSKHGRHISDVARKARNAVRRMARKNNPQKEREKRRIEKLRYFYGLEQEEYIRILALQGACCAICGSRDPGGNRFSEHFQIDHNHLTGKVRGLLCSKCNRGLGLLGDTAESISRVLQYLNKSEDNATQFTNSPAI